MGNNEVKISKYIDQLNAEKKPKEHEKREASSEYEKLTKTVRRVRSLKEPEYPEGDYLSRLTANLSNDLERSNSKQSKVWISVTLAAAVLACIFIINFINPFGNTNIVNAMEKAFQEVKAYHGIIEITQINALGEESIQAKREVWADQDGNYHVKELEGSSKDLITINNGQTKWQIREEEKNIYIFPAFPDAYRFTFEIGKEVEEVKNALETKVIGEENISGRTATIVEVTPKGGENYRLWIDKKTKLPLQRQTSMQNALQYRVSYRSIDFIDTIPEKYLVFSNPESFPVINTNPEQIVNNLEEAMNITGFAPVMLKNIPQGYVQNYLSVATDTNTYKIYFNSLDKNKTVVVRQAKAEVDFTPKTSALLGTVNNSTAELLTSVEGNEGILIGGGIYEGVTNVRSIRWQEDGFEYTVLGNISFDDLTIFVEGISKGEVLFPVVEETISKPEIEVPFDLEVEENAQKSVDAGHSPWRLDPAFVAQVFASLLITPEGIQGEYPIPYENIKITKNNGVEAIAEITGESTIANRVYLKRLVRQDETGIWTVVGYDSVNK